MPTLEMPEAISTGEDLVNLYTYAASLETPSTKEILDILSLGEQVVGESVRVEEIAYRNREKPTFSIRHFNVATRAGVLDAETHRPKKSLKELDDIFYIPSSGLMKCSPIFKGRIAQADPTTPFMVLRPEFPRYPLGFLLRDRWWARVHEDESLTPLVTVEFL